MNEIYECFMLHISELFSEFSVKAAGLLIIMGVIRISPHCNLSN